MALEKLIKKSKRYLGAALLSLTAYGTYSGCNSPFLPRGKYGPGRSPPIIQPSTPESEKAKPPAPEKPITPPKPEEPPKPKEPTTPDPVTPPTTPDPVTPPTTPDPVVPDPATPDPPVTPTTPDPVTPDPPVTPPTTPDPTPPSPVVPDPVTPPTTAEPTPEFSVSGKNIEFDFIQTYATITGEQRYRYHDGMGLINNNRHANQKENVEIIFKNADGTALTIAEINAQFSAIKEKNYTNGVFIHNLDGTNTGKTISAKIVEEGEKYFLRLPLYKQQNFSTELTPAQVSALIYRVDGLTEGSYDLIIDSPFNEIESGSTPDTFKIGKLHITNSTGTTPAGPLLVSPLEDIVSKMVQIPKDNFPYILTKGIEITYLPKKSDKKSL